MAGEILASPLNLAGAGQAVNAGIYQVSLMFMVILIICGVLGFIGFMMYKKTFNVGIMIFDNTKGGVLIRDGFRGKYTQLRPGEFRFKIFDAKKYRFRYNQESLSPEDFYPDIAKNGKLRRKVILAYDTEGQLVPLRLSPMKSLVAKLDVKGNPVRRDDGSPVIEERNYLGAAVKQVDVAWYFKELDKIDELFDARSAFDRWGWVVLVACMILILGAFMYNSYKFGTAAANLLEVTKHTVEIMQWSQNGTLVVAR